MLYFIKQNNVYNKIVLEDIVYIEAHLNSCVIVSKNKKSTKIYSLNISITDVTKTISKYNSNIVRIHRSYSVNINKINTIEGNTIYMNNVEVGLRISSPRKNQLFKETIIL